MFSIKKPLFSKNSIYAMFLSVCGLFCTFVTSCVKSGIDTKNIISLNFVEIQDFSSPEVKADLYFSNLVFQRSHGRIIINLVPCNLKNKMLSTKDYINQVRFGAVDFLRVSFEDLSLYSSDFAVLGFPYLFKNESHLQKTLEGKIGQGMLQKLLPFGMEGLCFYDAGARCFYAKDKLFSVQDFRHYPNIQLITNKNRPHITDTAKRFVVNDTPIMKAFVKNLGGQPVALSKQDTLLALATGGIDGAEGSLPFYYHSEHCDYAQYFCQDFHTRDIEIVLASRPLMAQLEKGDYYLIKDCALEAAAKEREYWSQEEQTIKDLLKKTDIVNVQLIEQTKRAFVTAATKCTSVLSVEQKDLLNKINALK